MELVDGVTGEFVVVVSLPMTPAAHPRLHASSGEFSGELCGVCLDEVGLNLYHLPCGHMLHRPCLAGFARSRLFRGEVARCYDGENRAGEIACGKQLPDLDLSLLLTPSDWATGLRLRAQRADVTLRFCPRPACGAQVSGGGAGAPALTCSACAQEFCWLHATAHPDTTCTEYEARADVIAEETLSANAISATAKACPRCAAWVERSGGCNVIVCASCGGSYCWLCLALLPLGDECEWVNQERGPKRVAASKRVPSLRSPLRFSSQFVLGPYPLPPP